MAIRVVNDNWLANALSILITTFAKNNLYCEIVLATHTHAHALTYIFIYAYNVCMSVFRVACAQICVHKNAEADVKNTTFNNNHNQVMLVQAKAGSFDANRRWS